MPDMTPPSAWAAAVGAIQMVAPDKREGCTCLGGPDGDANLCPPCYMCPECQTAWADRVARAALPYLLRAADTEDAEGACFVQKVHDDTWELWCANPGVGAQPVGSYRLASFGTYAECRAVCNALNRVLARALTDAAGRVHA